MDEIRVSNSIIGINVSRFCCAYAVTLYLILFVEFVRHTMDSAAKGRPFFTAVLKMVYSECKKV